MGLTTEGTNPSSTMSSCRVRPSVFNKCSISKHELPDHARRVETEAVLGEVNGRSFSICKGKAKSRTQGPF